MWPIYILIITYALQFVNYYDIIFNKKVGANMPQYYDGTKLLSLQDIYNEKPEIYICTTNRTAGKTTFFNRYCFKRWKKYKEKFCLLYRFKYELSNVADKFFKDIGPLFFPGVKLTSTSKMGGMFHTIEEVVGDTSVCCGYAVSLNAANQLKSYSHLLSDVSRILFDEFQAENNRYCTDEIMKFNSIHVSLARGQGEQVRYLPVIMLSNPISIINPYYTELGISERLKLDTKFLRGEGFVLEQGFYEEASNALKSSAFNRAFKSNRYVAYATEAIYLNDDASFVSKLDGRSNYICTLKHNNDLFAIRGFSDYGLIYCDSHADITFKQRYSVSTEDHDVDYVLFKSNQMLVSYLRYYFEKGAFRFQDIKCKAALMAAISY